MKRLVFGLLSLALFATACKKSKDAPAITKENIAGTYKITKQIVKEQGQADVDVFASADACQKDNLHKLNLDGSHVTVDAGIVCDPASDAQGTWDLSGTTITIDETPLAVTKFDGSILEVTYSGMDGSTPYTKTTTFQKQ